MANNSSHKAHSLTLTQAGTREANNSGRLGLTAETSRTGGSRSRGEARFEAENRTRDVDAQPHCAHQLSHRFTLSHIKRAPSQAYIQRGLQLPHTRSFGRTNFWIEGSSRRSLSPALQPVASDGTCSKRAQQSITVTGCLEKNKRVTSSFKPRCSSNKSPADRSHSRVTPEQRIGSPRVN